MAAVTRSFERMAVSPSLVWFRQDQRLQDNPALVAAVARGGAVLPVYILDEAGEGKWPMGGAGRWWLHHALAALDASLRQRGSRLLIAHGNAGEVLGDLVKATGAGAVFWNRRYEPAVIARDAAIKAALTAGGVEPGQPGRPASQGRPGFDGSSRSNRRRLRSRRRAGGRGAAHGLHDVPGSL
jgi:hypothetical protein